MSQKDLAGGDIETAGGYVTSGNQVDSLKQQTLEVIKRVPELQHIAVDDFDCIVALKQKTKAVDRPDKVAHVWAECVFTHEVVRSVVQAQGASLPPYLLVFYPLYFKLKDEEQIKVRIHELKHIKTTKKGVVPHYGFGDSEVDAMYKRFFT